MFPPFDPDRDERKRRPVFARGQVPVRVLIPNIFTLVGLCAGLTAIRMGIEHRWDLAVAALVFAAFLDGIDGHVARLLKASSRFGAELDSLADFVNFGVAPAIIMFNWALEDLRSLGWIAVLVFAVCSALRLARFNVSLDRTDLPAWKSNYFVGVPAPQRGLSSCCCRSTPRISACTCRASRRSCCSIRSASLCSWSAMCPPSQAS